MNLARSSTTAPAASAAAARLGALGLPHWRQENWRYANLRSLDDIASFEAAPVNSTAHANDAATALALAPERIVGFKRLVMIDGRFSASLSDLETIAPLQSMSSGDSPFELLAERYQSAAWQLTLHDGAKLELLHLGRTAAARYPRLLIEVQAGAQARLIERLVSAGDAGLHAPVTHIRLRPEARLQHSRLQAEGAACRWYDTLRVSLDAQAHWEHNVLLLGAASARSTMLVDLDGSDAEARINCLAVGAGQQNHDLACRVQHRGVRGVSTLQYRGLAGGQARLAAGADALVEASAIDADVRQSLRGLVENAGAEIDLKPRLTIQTDRVKAAHGAATGALDEQMLFYLLSRGIAVDTARGLLKWAFIADVLRPVQQPELRAAVIQAVAGHAGLGGLREALS